jgi:hypothetical protein
MVTFNLPLPSVDEKQMSLPTFIEHSKFDFTNVQKMDYKENFFITVLTSMLILVAFRGQFVE